jgi:hypothetical protein
MIQIFYAGNPITNIEITFSIAAFPKEAILAFRLN